MKRKIYAGKEPPLEAPDRKAMLLRAQLLSGNWALLRLLALAEPPKPCRRHVD
jgi:hypothetical protein